MPHTFSASFMKASGSNSADLPSKHARPKLTAERFGSVFASNAIAANAGGGYNHGMKQDLARILISRDRIKERVSELAEEIAETYGPESQGLVIVPVLSGSIIFVADLIRCLPFKMHIGLVTISRYRGRTTEGGDPLVIQDLRIDIEDRHVLIVDDILDTGSTLRKVSEELRKRRPASLRICTLLRKPDKAPKDVVADFVGFDIEDAFVVGYGLDFNDQYRNWPDIAVLKTELYE